MATTQSSHHIMAAICWSIVLLLGTLIGIHWILSNQQPAIVIPPLPKPPSPNAYDYYLRAYQKLQDTAKKTTSTGRAPGDVWSSTTATKDQWAKKQLAIAVTGDGLLLLHEGFNYQYQAPITRSVSAPTPHYDKYLNIARYLELRASVLEAQGDWSGAIESNLDAVRLGNDTLKDRTLFGSFVGIGIQVIGRNNIWQRIDHLTNKDARTDLLRMEAIIHEQTSLEDCVRGEKISGEVSLLAIFKQRGWRKEMVDILTPTDTSSRPLAVERVFREFKALTLSKQHILNDYIRSTDRIIVEAQKPYPARKSVAINAGIADVITHNFQRVEEIFVVNEAENTMLLTTIALQAYKTDHGAYPALLSDLTPTYLKTLSADPFAFTGPLHYQRSKEKYLLYSIGPDGKDDGGKPIDSGKKSSRQRYQIFPDSKPGKGDVVAGVNLY